MPRLNISLFGTFNATLNEQVVRAFETEKARALLAYLAVEAARAQRREKLAGLLWPNMPEGRARQNLSQALYSLRVLLGERQIGDRHADEEGGSSQVQPILLVLRDTLQLNPHSKTWVDVHAFTCLLESVARHPHRRLADCPACLAQLEEAVALHRGDFLSGFSLRDSSSFEEWMLVEREHLRRLDLEALNRLVACRAERGELELALRYAWRQVEMDPLWEHAQRQLIELLARSGRRDAALAQY